MRPPDFWNADAIGRDRAPVLQALMWPLSLLYGAAGAHRLRSARSTRVDIAVVCVGNLTLGGAGKTPVTRAIRAKLGAGAHVLSRGYGGARKGVVRVTQSSLAHDVGDEPLLHAADGPAWVSADRVAGARAALAAGARALLLDDGFQNPTLAKDLSIVVIDTSALFGNGKVFPAGPMREPAVRGLKRADAIVLLGPEIAPEAWPGELRAFARPILRAMIAPTAPPPDGPLVAFAGIARPEKFFDTLIALGATLDEAVPFPDHHTFSPNDLSLLAHLASERGARLITTEKDAARLAPDWRARVAVLPVAARFADEAALEALLAPIAARMRVGA